MEQAVNHFEDAFNNRPLKIRIPELRYALEIWESKLLEAGMPPFRELISEPGRKDANLFFEFIKYICGRCEHTLQALYFAAIERRAKDSDYYKFISMFQVLKMKLDDLLGGDALLLVPTHPEPAPHHYLTIPKYPNQAYTCIFNVLGYPSTQIPAGLCSGLPIGIQAISCINNDSLSISAAVELDKVFGGWQNPSKITV